MQIPDLQEFDNIIIGSSIYMGQIQKKLKVFCTQNVNSLVNKRFSLFLSCGLPENFQQTLKNSFPDELLEKAVVKECFGGELRTDRMKFADKMVSSLMKRIAVKEGKAEVGPMPQNILRLVEAMNTCRKGDIQDAKV